MNTSSFDWNGATITVMAPNGFSRARMWRYGANLGDADDLHPLVNELGSTILFYLSLVTSVNGDPGFHIPVTNATHAELIAFIEAVGFADGALLEAFDNAVVEVQSGTNDPDLLPPEAMEKKASKAPKSKTKDAASA
jgi:hypothetical protein